MVLSALAFDWRSGVLEWLLVLEVVILLTMAGFRYVAGLLGRGSPSDPFVIFYRVFWQAMRSPKRYPVPVNYEPVPPREKKVRRVDEAGDGVGGLTDEELERLMDEAAGCDDTPPAASLATRALERARPAPADDLALLDALDVGDDENEDEDDDEPAVAPMAAAKSLDAGAGGGTVQSVLPLRVVSGPSPQVIEFDGDALTVSTGFGPDDGRSNAVAIRLLCAVAGVEPHQVALLDGHTRAAKTTRVSGLSAGQLRTRLFKATIGGATSAPPPPHKPRPPVPKAESSPQDSGWGKPPPGLDMNDSISFRDGED